MARKWPPKPSRTPNKLVATVEASSGYAWRAGVAGRADCRGLFRVAALQRAPQHDVRDLPRTPLATQSPLPILTPASEVSTPMPAASITAPAVKPAANGPMDLLVSVIAATHLLVLADGTVAFYDEVHSGENRHFTANDSFEVTAADCGAVLLELNSQPLPPLGVAGSSGTIRLSHDDLRRTTSGNPKP